MRMRDQYDIDRGKVAQPHSRLAQPLQHEQPARKIRVDQHILPAHLQKKAGVANEGDAEFAVAHELGFVALTNTRGDGGVPYQASELLRALAQYRILQTASERRALRSQGRPRPSPATSCDLVNRELPAAGKSGFILEHCCGDCLTCIAA